MKKNISFVIFITVIFFSVSDIYAQKSSQAKRVYITNLERKDGVSSETADKIRDIIKITMLEKPGNEYRIISDDDIKVMFKKAESLQAAGCDDESCSLNIAQAIKADEIIYGNVSRESGKVKVTAYNLETGTAVKQRGAGTKSMVNVSFDETELEWMSREIGLKLINPKYKITKAPVFNEKINITPIEITPVKKGEITEIKFENNETSLNAIVDYYKGIVDEGDVLFSKGEYKAARKKYQEITVSIQRKMTVENQRKIDSFFFDIKKRISDAVKMEYKPQIEKIDKSIISEKNPDENDYRDALEDYDEIINDIVEITGERVAITEIHKILYERHDLMILSIVAIVDKKGDIDYRNYRFNDALKKYMAARKSVFYLYDIQIKNKINDGINKKINTTLSTGNSYLENIVNSYIDQAEYYNVTSNHDDAKETMDKARIEISGPMRKFATEELMMRYNDYVSMIPGAKELDNETKALIKGETYHEEDDASTLKGCVNKGCFYGSVVILVILYGIFAGGL